jgi:hypothetical protein
MQKIYKLYKLNNFNTDLKNILIIFKTQNLLYVFFILIGYFILFKLNINI